MNSGSLAKLFFIALVFLLLSASPAYAAGFNANDSASLVSAINSANGNSEPDTITITADITLTANLPAITTYIAFRSSDGNRFTISGNNARRIFTVTEGGRLSIQNLVIANGNSGNANGGAISVTKGELELLNAVVRNSTAGTGTGINTAFKGGGISVVDDRSSGDGSSVSITRSAIHSNTAYDQGGGIFIQGRVRFTLFQSAVYSNTTKKDGANGGGLSFLNWANTPATFTIVNSSIYGNTTPGRGGGINASLNLQANVTSVLTLRHVTITGNSSSLSNQHRANGLYARNLKITIQNSIISGNFNAGSSGDEINCIFEIIPASGGNSPTLAHNIIGAGSNSTQAPHCGSAAGDADPQLAASPEGSPPYYNLQPGSPAIDTIPNAACFSASEGGDRDQRGRARPNPPGGACDKGAIEYYAPPPVRSRAGVSPPPPSNDVGGSSGSSGGGDGDGGSSQREAPRGALAPTSTCLLLGPEVVVNDATVGTACQVVEPSGYGHSDLMKAEAMPSKVVDVWGWVTPDTEVCFQGGGSIKFVDTMASSRTISTLPAVGKDGMVCAMIKGAGQVAHVPGPAPSQAQDPPPKAAPQPTAIPSRSLSDCMVKANYLLNMRDAPAGAKIGEVAWNATLTALERTPGWIKVDNMGKQGWIAAMYVEPKGDCG